MTIQLLAGATFRPKVYVLDPASGGPLTGYTGLVAYVARGDNQMWDFGGTPQFRASGWTTQRCALVEIDAVNMAGWYWYAAGVDTTGFSVGVYNVTYLDTGTGAAGLPTIEDFQIQASSSAPSAAVVAAAVWDYLTASAVTGSSFGALLKLQLDAAIGSRLATGGYTVPPTAAAISTQVGSDLTTAHGAGSWATATGFSTLTAAQVWATAVPGAFSAGQAGNILGNMSGGSSPSVIAAAVWQTVVPGTFTSGQAGNVISAVGDTVVSQAFAVIDEVDARADQTMAAIAAAITTIDGHTTTSVAPLATTAGLASTATGINAHTDGAVAPLATTTGLASSVAPLATTSGLASSVAPLATTSGLASTATGINTHTDGAVAALATAAALTAAVTTIDGHTDGAVAPLATSAGLSTAAAGINTHTDGAVASLATTTAVAAVQTTVNALPSAGAVAAAVAARAEGGAPGSFGYDLMFARMLSTNRIEETPGDPGVVRLYADDGVTVFKTWNVRDYAGNAVAPVVGQPARRGAAT